MMDHTDQEMDRNTDQTWNQNHDADLHTTIIIMRANGLTIPAICQELGLPECRVRAHLEQAGLVRHGKRGAQAKTYKYKRKYFTIPELAELAGTSHSTMGRRLMKWDVKRAVEMGPTTTQ